MLTEHHELSGHKRNGPLKSSMKKRVALTITVIRVLQQKNWNIRPRSTFASLHIRKSIMCRRNKQANIENFQILTEGDD